MPTLRLMASKSAETRFVGKKRRSKTPVEAFFGRGPLS